MTDTTKKLTQYLEGGKPTMVEFYIEGDAACAEMNPIVSELAQKQAGKANVLQIDAKQNPQIAEKYHVHSYPTWILFIDGQEAWRDGGRKHLDELTDMCHRFE